MEARAELFPQRFNLTARFLDAPAIAHPERAAILGEPPGVTYGELRALANAWGTLLDSGCDPASVGPTFDQSSSSSPRRGKFGQGAGSGPE